MVDFKRIVLCWLIRFHMFGPSCALNAPLLLHATILFYIASFQLLKAPNLFIRPLFRLFWKNDPLIFQSFHFGNRWGWETKSEWKGVVFAVTCCFFKWMSLTTESNLLSVRHNWFTQAFVEALFLQNVLCLEWLQIVLSKAFMKTKIKPN